jgi:hypothetical protein
MSSENPDSDIIGRVAKAIQNIGCSCDDCARGVARQAIKAMREPTEVQMTRGYQFLLADSASRHYREGTDAEKMERMRGFYRACIKAALEDFGGAGGGGGQ